MHAECEPTPAPSAALTKVKANTNVAQSCQYVTLNGSHCDSAARFELVDCNHPFRCGKHCALKSHYACGGSCGIYTSAAGGLCARCALSTSAAAVEHRKRSTAEARATATLKQASAKVAAAEATLAALAALRVAPPTASIAEADPTLECVQA